MWKSKDSIVGLMLRLLIITAAAGLILGIVYSITEGPIAEQEMKKATEARIVVLPDAQDFEMIYAVQAEDELPDGVKAVPEDYAEIQQVYEGMAGGSTVGYTMAVVTKGYSAGLSLTVGIGMNGTVTGVNIGSHEETAGLGANAAKPEFLDQFAATTDDLAVVKNNPGENEIQALTGATITSDAVANAVNNVRSFFEEYLQGGA